MTEWKVSVDESGEVTALLYAANTTPFACLILAHGAGAGQRSPFMTSFSRALAGLGVDVVTFNFLYTERRRRLPDRRPLLEHCYRSVVRSVRDEVPSAAQRLFIGGKSMGGRIATHIASDDRTLPVEKIVLLGYPLHPPGKPDQRRDAHLPHVGRQMLFVQGSRDAFGTPAELKAVLEPLSPPATLHIVEGGDHSFKVAKFGVDAQAAIYDDVQRTIVEWMRATR